MRRSLLALSIAAVLSAPCLAQPATDAPGGGEASVPLTYVGSNARVSLGVNEHGDVQGEVLGIFAFDGDSAWLAQLWKGQGKAGGAQLDYHWLLGDKTRQDSIDHPETVRVAKAFLAFDQNAWKDGKASLGLGWQKDDFFLDGYVSAATTGTRRTGTVTSSVDTVLSGVEGGHSYTQTQTVTTVTDYFERPYEHGVGLRLGRYFDDPLLRLRGGLDYERGRHGAHADQLTLSLGVDKYFRNSGWSLSLEGEHLKKSGTFEDDRSDDRGWLLLRYEFGQSFRARDPYRMVQVERPAAPASAPTAPQVVRNEVRLDGDAFFDFDHADLRPDAVAALDALLQKLASAQRVSRIRVVGHTDSIGTDAYNQALSERRAASAKAYLVRHGIPVGEIDAAGEGERNPRFPNDTPANRQKNRRVDVEFLTVEETTVPAPPPPAPAPTVEWVKETVAAPAAWIERALRDPAQHKRTVDVYRFAKSGSMTTLGNRQFANAAPLAVDDKVQLDTCRASFPIRVLDNDSDPDHDPLTVVAVGGAAKGVVSIGSDGVLTYSVTPGQGTPPVCEASGGGDSFTYTIKDSFGATATATVRILPPAVVPPADGNRPPVARDDEASVLKGYGVDINVLANDSDPDGDRLRVVAVNHDNGYPADVSINADGSLRYQHHHGATGLDVFTYTVSDDHGHTATATVRVRVFEIF